MRNCIRSTKARISDLELNAFNTPSHSFALISVRTDQLLERTLTERHYRQDK